MFKEKFKLSPIKLAVFLLSCFILLVIFIIVCFNPREPFKKLPQDNKPSVESDNIILSWPSLADAKEYILQVDDNSNFNSPIVEKRVSGSKTNLVVNLPKESKSYYWRVKTVNENNIEGDWQRQGDLKKSFHEEDFAILMDGEYYHIMTLGSAIMEPFASLIRPEDKWKIILYIKNDLAKQNINTVP